MVKARSWLRTVQMGAFSVTLCNNTQSKIIMQLDVNLTVDVKQWMSTQDNINTIMETIIPEMYFVLVSLKNVR